MRVLLPILLASCDGDVELDAPVSVPASWKEYRRGRGHVVHLAKGTRCRDCHRVLEGSRFEGPSMLVCDACHAGVTDRSHTSTSALHDSQAERAPSQRRANSRGPALPVRDPMNCLACHPFAEKTDVSENACERCHTELRIHAEPDCTECHAPHSDPPILISSCVKCHEEKPPAIHAGMGDVLGCVACHTGHAPAAAAAAGCDRCHGAKATATRKGHDACRTCHVPHGAQNSCASCHRAERSGRHEACTDCHLVHAEPRAVGACESCHADLLVEHGEGTGECAECHAPHRPRTPCARCHTILASSPPPRSGHGPSLADTSHAGGIGCEACHRPHALSAPDAVACDACHAEEERLASANEGHAECTACHLGAHHAPARAPKACSACHDETERKGHDACGLCHEVHTGAPKAEATCADCHASKPNLHSSPPLANCVGCHQAHRADAGCRSCHPAPPGGHRVSGHADCAGCHRAHDATVEKGRRACDRCHTLPDHEPTAKSCVGCHPFDSP